MGGGNGAKAATKRARNLEKAKDKAGGVSQLKTNQASMSIVCQVCRQTFMKTASEVQLKGHWESKHDKLPLAQCFPELASA